MTETLRIIQYGVGPIGASIVRVLAEKENAEFVGAIDLDEEKVGKDLGRVAGLDRDLGIVISNDATEVLRTRADAVVHTTSSYLENVKDQLLRSLRSGHNVVSTCEELAYPFRKAPETARELDAAARSANVTLHATGVNPGFVMDKLALTLSSVCQKVNRVEVLRVVDAGQRRLPLQLKVGATLTTEQFESKVKEGIIKHHGLPESAWMIADLAGLEVKEVSETIEPVMCGREVTTAFLTVKSGEVAGVRQVCRGVSESGDEVLRLELQMYVGAHDARDEIKIFGVPDLTLSIDGGTHGDVATAAAVVNAIPLVVQTDAGLKTAADLPVRFFRKFEKRFQI